VVLGVRERARAVRAAVENPYILPAHAVVAFVDVPRVDREPAGDETVIDGVPIVRSTGRDLPQVVRSLGANLIILAFDDQRAAARLYPQLKRLRFEGIEVLTPLTVAEIYSGRTPLDYLDEESLMQASMESSVPMVRRVKRLFDILMSVVAFLVLAPLALLIALLIKLSAWNSPVLYSQIRVGLFGAPFRIHKFRTMVPEAEQESGAVWATGDDPRITRLGRVLRRFRLDELPQFVNILRGDMSIVGPRPERPELMAELAAQIPFFHERENIIPGLTGWAQIQYPYGSTVEDAKRKLEYDLYYLKHLSLSLDLQIILRTLRIVVMGKERRM
jgi:exopolysaccharide biosynthesis polyprenyl glycosylphosphotransferase